MYRVLSIKYLVLLACFAVLALLPKAAFAQDVPSLSGVSANISIAGENVAPGDIISSSQNGFKKSDTEYDPLIYGVVVSAPVLSIGPKSDSTKPVLSSGQAQVKVSAHSGEIKEGDFVTSTTDAGVGQKATKAGYVLGRALASYKDSNPGLIPVSINIEYFGGITIGGPLGGAATGLISIVADPKNARYVLAALVGLVLLIAIDVAFIRLISTGITAIGRNPLARTIIIRSMIIAGVVIAILAIAGVGIIIGILTLGR